MSQTFSAEALERGLRASLLPMVAGEAPILVDLLCDVQTSDGEDEKHEYLSEAPQMTEFEGSRKTTPLIGKSQTVPNTIYDAAVLVSRDDLRRNRTGSIQRQVNRLANVVRSFPNKLVIDTLIAGTTDTGYDGVSFFNDTHPALGDEGTQDNLIPGTGTTAALLADDIMTLVMNYFSLVKGTNNEPFHGDTLDGMEIIILHHPSIKKGMAEALEATIISNTSNVVAGVARAIVSPRLVDVDDWYAFVRDRNQMPLVWQNEQLIETDVTAEGSELWKTKRQAQFGASASLGNSYLFWQSAVKITN